MDGHFGDILERMVRSYRAIRDSGKDVFLVRDKFDVWEGHEDVLVTRAHYITIPDNFYVLDGSSVRLNEEGLGYLRNILTCGPNAIPFKMIEGRLRSVEVPRSIDVEVLERLAEKGYVSRRE